jgi:hypothetical protein
VVRAAGAPAAGDAAADARNAAVAAAAGALLAFCGADCRPSPGWLAAGTRALTEAELVQGRVEGEPRAEPGPFAADVSVTEESGLYDAGNLFVTRALFDRLGGFQGAPGSAPTLDSGTWLAWRARRSGAGTAYSAEALAHRPATALEPREYVAERDALRQLPHRIATLPELRDSLLHRRLFLSRRSMKLDLALAGLAMAAARRSKLPLLLAAPYALELRRHARERGGDDWKAVAAVDAAADLRGAAALARGSVAARTPVL